MDLINKEAADEMTYEGAIGRLEEIVTVLERGESSLDEAMDLFREGVALSSFCTDKLRAMKEEMQKLVDADGTAVPIKELE